MFDLNDYVELLASRPVFTDCFDSMAIVVEQREAGNLSPFYSGDYVSSCGNENLGEEFKDWVDFLNKSLKKNNIFEDPYSLTKFVWNHENHAVAAFYAADRNTAMTYTVLVVGPSAEKFMLTVTFLGMMKTYNESSIKHSLEGLTQYFHLKSL